MYTKPVVVKLANQKQDRPLVVSLAFVNPPRPKMNLLFLDHGVQNLDMCAIYESWYCQTLERFLPVDPTLRVFAVSVLSAGRS